jgi:hypothetical protein
MSSTSGIRDGDFDRLTIVQDLGVGQDQNFGTSGQVLTSGGEGEELFWGTNSATLPQGLLAGTNITFTPAGTYNGSVETTISATDTNTEYTGTAPIDISVSDVISLNKDATLTTISDNLSVVKVPNTLTITDSAGTSVVFDGSATTSITINDDDTTYQAGTGISIDTSTDPDTINCSNIPNSALANFTISGISLGSNLANLTAGTNISFDVGTTYNGSTAITISATDTDTGITDLNEGDGINITSISATEKTISANIDSNTLEFKTDTLGAPEPKEIAVKKVPNDLTFTGFRTGTYNGGGVLTIDLDDIPNTALTNSTISGKELGTNLSNLVAGTNITFSVGTTYDGSQEIIISSADDTTLNLIEGNGISIVSSGADRTISVNPDGTTLSNNIFSGQTEVLKVPNTLTTSSTGNTTSDIRIQYASGTGTTYDGSALRRFRVLNTGFAVEIHPTTDTTYTVYRRRYFSSLTYPRQTIDYFYPIDTNFYYNNLPRISTEASGDFEVDVSFCMSVDKKPTVNERVYVRLDEFVSTSYPTYGTGIVEPQVASMVPSTGIKKTMRYNVKFLVRLGVIDASYGFYPAVAQYSSAGTDDSQTNTADILYGQTWGSLTMTIKPLDHWVGKQTASNPFTIPPSGEDY